MRKQVEEFAAERERWEEERERLTDELDTLRNRCQKLARAAAAQADVPKTEVSVQTEPVEFRAAGSGGDFAEAVRGLGNAADGEASAGAVGGGRLPPVVEQMLRCPKDEAVQLKGIEALFAQQTQVDGAAGPTTAPALQASLEAAVAVFGNHPGNRALLLKACQLLSVLLAEPGAQQQLPVAVLWQAAQAVVAVSIQLIADVAASGADAAMTAAKTGSAVPNPPKLLNWFLSLLSLLLPCLGPQLRNQAQAEAFVHDLLANLVSKVLSSAELAPQEALVLKCVQLLPLLPMDPWLQKACLSSGAVHALALAYQRWKRSPAGSAAATSEAAFPKGIHVAVRGVFADNLELCVKAVEDTFVSDEFVCLEVLDQLRTMERRRRGTFRDLDKDHGIVGKALNLWGWHQRAVLEAQDPQTSPSREVLVKVAELLNAVILKLPPLVLLQRMKEFESSEVLQRLALSSIHGSAQLRLQLAVNYVDNGVVPAVIGCMQLLLQGVEGAAGAPANPQSAWVEAAFGLLQDEALPADCWPYLSYCLEVCLHVLSHWSATKLSLQKADVLDARAAPLLLAQGGLVDVLAEVLDPKAAGVELIKQPPSSLVQKATETLQALFEQNGHICLFCMQHYTEVRQMVSLGCESLCIDPLMDFPEMQQQAVSLLLTAFEKFVEDERLVRKILKALTGLFESSYQLVSWFLQHHGLSDLGEYQSLDVHVEAVRAVCRTPYWSAQDAPMLPEFVALLAQLLLDSIEGQSDVASKDVFKPDGTKKRLLDLTEAEELVEACMSSVLHLLLIDPQPPTVLRVLARSLSRHGTEEANTKLVVDDLDDEKGGANDERAVNAVMKVMQVFPSSDRVQMNCQHLLTSLLGE